MRVVSFQRITFWSREESERNIVFFPHRAIETNLKNINSIRFVIKQFAPFEIVLFGDTVRFDLQLSVCSFIVLCSDSNS